MPSSADDKRHSLNPGTPIPVPVPSWRDALTASEDGVTLLLEVIPNAQETRFPSGYNPWRNRIQSRLAAPAQDGEANDELRRAAGGFFHAASADVIILEGATSRLKRLQIRGVPLERAQKLLEGALP